MRGLICEDESRHDREIKPGVAFSVFFLDRLGPPNHVRMDISILLELRPALPPLPLAPSNSNINHYQLSLCGDSLLSGWKVDTHEGLSPQMHMLMALVTPLQVVQNVLFFILMHIRRAE